MTVKPLIAILALASITILLGCGRTATSTSAEDGSAKPATHQSKQAHEADTQQTRTPASSVLPSSHPIYKKWRHTIETAVLSPDAKWIALYDGMGVFLTDDQGKHVRKLPITLFQKLANEEVSVNFAFRPDSKRIAILTTLNYGEPMGAFIERLWTADVATGKPRLLSKWEDRIQGSSPVTAERKIEGWTKDGSAIAIIGTVYSGEEMPVDAQRTGTQRTVIKDSSPSG